MVRDLAFRTYPTYITMDDTNLLWAWAAVIEILAATPEVDESVLLDVIEKAPDIPDDMGKNMREMLAFRCLDKLSGSDAGNRNRVSSALDAKSRIDPSRSCEDVLQDILDETSGSILNGSELVKWDIKSFIAAKRTSLPKVASLQLKETLLEAPGSYASLLREINELEFPAEKVHHCVPDRVTKLPEVQDGGNLSPSKRHRAEAGAEHLEKHLHGSQNFIHDSDDLHPNSKKVNRGASRDIQNGKGKQILEDSSDRRDQINDKEGWQLEKDKAGISYADVSGFTTNIHVASQRSHQTDVDRDEYYLHQSEFHSCSNMIPQVALSGDLPPSNNVINGEGNAELEVGQRQPNGAPRDGTLQISSANDSQGNCERDVQVETEEIASPGTLPQKNVRDGAINVTECKADAEKSSDSDGHDNERFDISGKKHEFLSSQCPFSCDSLSNTEFTEQTICIKCRKDGDLLVCSGENCVIALHEKCLGYPVTFDGKGDFYCPFCSCAIAMRDYRRARKEASSARRKLSAFICNRDKDGVN